MYSIKVFRRIRDDLFRYLPNTTEVYPNTVYDGVDTFDSSYMETHV